MRAITVGRNLGGLWAFAWVRTIGKFPPRVVKGCVGKRRYKSEGAAQAGVRALVSYEERTGDKPEDAGPIKHYWCVRCKHWHIGHDSTPHSS
jgi:hypothetical protein